MSTRHVVKYVQEEENKLKLRNASPPDNSSEFGKLFSNLMP